MIVGSNASISLLSFIAEEKTLNFFGLEVSARVSPTRDGPFLGLPSPVKCCVKMNRCPPPFEHLLKTVRRVENKPKTTTEKSKLLFISLTKDSRHC
ncbi:hypothetical protein ES332_D02G109100v1 [Gossypium tomentosum]|uniref:Uncharacterized protein n=1 Tax=Gossypium tomentosum TaxID=34277 RepID=A0A5D2LVL7_GOSTO|nr:hypothetical protein ES332_D02G109100v1 [Gossypium tomentosum]